MIYNRPRRKTKPKNPTIELSGSFHSAYGFVEIDGKTYTSAQTITVASGTSVTVTCSARFSDGRVKCTITLNKKTVAVGTGTSKAEYTFAVTDHCNIEMDLAGTSTTRHYNADITMPA